MSKDVALKTKSSEATLRGNIFSDMKSYKYSWKYQKCIREFYKIVNFFEA